MLRPLQNRKGWHFMKVVAAPPVPRHDFGMDVNSLNKRLITLRVGSVNRFPRWEDQHGPVEWVQRECCSQFGVRKH